MNTNHKNILIIDDDPDILDALQMMLEYDGYEVKTSEKAEYVDKLFDKDGHLPKLIILDVLLSGKDGRTICKKLKSESKTKHIPIIMISAHPDADKSTREVGADDFLAKPFEMDSLLEKITKYILP